MPHKIFPVPLALLLTLCFASVAHAADVPPEGLWKPKHSAQWQNLLDAAVQKTLAQFKPENLGADEIAVTAVDMSDPQKPVQASYRGEVQIYPASVIKLFYLVAVHRWLEDGKLADTAELRRAMHDMIVDSYNEATGYVVDLLTETTSGPELSQKEIEEWWTKRNSVNRYFASLGYTNINVNKKPWCEGPYGREIQAVQLFEPRRNELTTDATARLMAGIVTGHAVSARRCEEMMDLLKRNPFDASSDPNSQARAFTGTAVPAGTKLWSKAGWTSETRHDCAYLELPDGHKLILVIFTVNHADQRQIIPGLARTFIESLPKN
jgi:hypothetical protein